MSVADTALPIFLHAPCYRGRKTLPGLPGVRGPRVAIINAVGEIGVNGAINAGDLNDLLESVQEDSRIKAVVLRIDSPGGDALTSELIWRRILKLRSVKPVVASMVDVAASGGYVLVCLSPFLSLK